jgi:hypothetical protein
MEESVKNGNYFIRIHVCHAIYSSFTLSLLSQFHFSQVSSTNLHSFTHTCAVNSIKRANGKWAKRFELLPISSSRWRTDSQSTPPFRLASSSDHLTSFFSHLTSSNHLTSLSSHLVDTFLFTISATLVLVDLRCRWFSALDITPQSQDLRVSQKLRT